MSDQNGDRRAVQRDWLGHGIQVIAIVATILLAIGIPLLNWSGNVNTAISNNTRDNTRLEQAIQADRLDNRAFQTEMRTALTSLSGALAELRVQIASEKGSKR